MTTTQPTLFDPQPVAPPQLIRIAIDGQPVAKGRGKIGKPIYSQKRGSMFTPVYTPIKTRKYESRISDEAAKVMKGIAPITRVVKVSIWVYVPIPNSMPKKHLSAAMDGTLRPGTKPDIDNYIKSALDGLNTIVIKDDNQVAELRAYKLYSDKPRMIIEVIVL